MAATATAPPVVLQDGVVEHGGYLWKPKPGATTTAEEFVAARSLIIELHKDSEWNPWVLEDRAADLEHAQAVFDQWRRAEPGFRPLTRKQFEARQARWDREWERNRAAEEKLREERKLRYGEQRERARLRLLECQSILPRAAEELAGYRDGTRFTRMDAGRRADEIAKLDKRVAGLETEIGELSVIVGDPEDVVDEHGNLPNDRRKTMLLYYRIGRERKVRSLREKIPQLQADLKACTDKKEAADLRYQVSKATRDLEQLESMPALRAEDMCSECVSPAATHGWVTPPFDGPCPAWPGWAARIQKVRDMLMAAAERSKPAVSAPPPPQPLAVIASKLPIAEVIEKLTEIQKTYPDAEVRRGRANRWEIWPARQPDQAPKG